MNQSEAKAILSGYNLTDTESLPEEAAEALEFAQSDPDLSAWLDAQESFDKQFKDALTAIPIPAGLETNILAAARDDEPPEGSMKTQRLIMLAVAAAMLLFAGLGLMILGQGGHSTEAFRLEMAQIATAGISLDHLSEDLEASKAWLDDRGYPAYPEVPEKLVRFRGMGCKTIDWGSEKVGLVCFVNDEGEVIHLFIIERESLSDIETVTKPLEKLAVYQQLETAGWIGEKHAYLLVASAPEVRIATVFTAK